MTPDDQARVLKPLNDDMDAVRWAKEFLAIFPNGCADHGTMLGWFANAIMCGHDFALRASRPTWTDARPTEGTWHYRSTPHSTPTIIVVFKSQLDGELYAGMYESYARWNAPLHTYTGQWALIEMPEDIP